MAKKDELKSKASQIKNEVEEGRNTANRVGGLLEEMVDGMIDYGVVKNLTDIL